MLTEAVIALALASQPAAPPKTFLASIRGVRLKANEYLSGFSIDTWGVEFLAVCHLPPGWSITAGTSASPDGKLSGQGSLGVTFLDPSRLSELNGLVLMTLVAPVQKEKIESASGIAPATFAGHAVVGTYGQDGDRRLRISYRNVVLTPAKACPPPAP